MFIAGVARYGKVDRVPGLFYVCTNFVHVYFVPLVPTGSYLMADDSTNRGMAIGLSGKSVLFAYLRTALVIGTPCVLVPAFVEGSEALAHGGNWHPPLILLSLAALLFYLLYLSYRWARPGPERALALAKQVGIPMEVLAQYFAKMKPYPAEESADPPADEFSENEPARDW